MIDDFPLPPQWVLDVLRDGLVIPAHPLALTAARKLDERRQRALTRYYHAAGAGGVAVGVHTTQFAIRDPQHGLLEPVLKLAVETSAACAAICGKRSRKPDWRANWAAMRDCCRSVRCGRRRTKHC
jgi:hypothetical protein